MWTHIIHPFRCCDIWAAGQYITLPTHSRLSYFSVLLKAYCNTTAYVVVAKTVAHKSSTYGNTNFITTIQFLQNRPIIAHFLLSQTPPSNISCHRATFDVIYTGLEFVRAFKSDLPLFARDFHIIFVTTNPQKLNAMLIRIHSGIWCHPGKGWHTTHCKACSILTSVVLIKSQT